MISSIDYMKVFADELINRIPINRDDKILDVGTGSGNCLVSASRKLGRKGTIIGIDNNQNQVDHAQKTIEQFSIQNASITKMDGTNINYDDKNFNVVICGFVGFAHFYNDDGEIVRNSQIMDEISRVLIDGGLAGFSSWYRQPEIDTLRRFMLEYNQIKNRRVTVGPGYERDTHQGIETLLKRSGLNPKLCQTCEFPVQYTSYTELVDKMMRHGSSAIKPTLTTYPEEQKEIKEYLLNEYSKNETLVYSKSVLFAVGEKPKNTELEDEGSA